MAITTRIIKTEPQYLIIVKNTVVFLLQYQVLKKVISNKNTSLFFIHIYIYIFTYTLFHPQLFGTFIRNYNKAKKQAKKKNKTKTNHPVFFREL